MRRDLVAKGTIRAMLLLVVSFTLWTEGSAQTRTPSRPLVRGEAIVVQDTVGETFLPYLGSESGRRFKFPSYDPLFTQDTDAWNKRTEWVIRPSLLESWRFSADWSEFSARVRRGVQFQKGRGELTAEDVAFLINQTVQNPKSGRSGAWKALNIAADAPSRYDVVIRGTPGQVSPSWIMSEPGQRLNAVPSRAYVQQVGDERADREPVGSGPYELVKTEPGVHVYRVIQDHWREQPNFEMLRVWQVPEPATRLALLTTGEADVAVLGEAQVPEAKSRGIRLVSADFAENAALYFGGLYLDPQDSRHSPDIMRQPWGDRRVRLAMLLALDREGIANGLLKGAVRLTATPYPTSQGSDLRFPRSNPDEAKRLLREAGYANGFPVTVIATDQLPSFKLVAEAIAAQWKAVGLDAKVEFQQNVTFNPTIRDLKSGSQFFGKVIMFSISSRPDWWPFMRFMVQSQLSGGHTLFSSPATRAIYRQWKLKPSDLEQARRLERRAVVELNDQIASIPLYATGEWFGLGRRVADYSPAPGALYRYETLRLR